MNTYNTKLQNNNTNLSSILDKVNTLPEASGGSSFETCEVTIIQQWGGNDDPEFLRLYIPYYKILADGNIEQDFVCLSSYSDFEAQHSITFTAFKNVPINVIGVTGLAGTIKYTTSVDGGTILTREVGVDSSQGFYSLIPTADVATFTFASD